METDMQKSLKQQFKGALPFESGLGQVLRRLKLEVNDVLWAVKPGGPQLDEMGELRQLRQIMRDAAAPPPNPAGKRILLFGMRAWRIHKVWEGLIGRGLIERGAQVTAIICDGLARCDLYSMTTPAHSPLQCRQCISYARQIFHLFGLPLQELSDFLEVPDFVEAKKIVAAWQGPYQAFTAEGLPLGEMVRPSLMRTLLRGSIEADPLAPPLYRDYLEASILLARAFRRMFDRLQPETLVLLNGMFFAERIGLAIAQERGLHTVTHEAGFMQNQMVLAHDEPACWLRVGQAWERASAQPLTAAEAKTLDDYLRQRETGQNLVVNYWPSVESRHEFIMQELGLNPNKPIVTLFTNILWDTAVYQSDCAFDGMFDWLESTIRQMNALPDLQLVIRIHPAEVRLPRQETRERVLDRLRTTFPTLPANVVVVPPESSISSYILLDLSRVVTVYTSTMGLEAALRGLPVLVAGETHYRGKGFTGDVTTRAGYAAALQAENTQVPLSAEQLMLARRYAHLFFFKSMIPIDLATARADGSIDLNLSSPADLKPGHNAILDHICTAIVDHTPFTLPLHDNDEEK